MKSGSIRLHDENHGLPASGVGYILWLDCRREILSRSCCRMDQLLNALFPLSYRKQDTVSNLPISRDRSTRRFNYDSLKRVVDVIGSTALLFALSPLLLLIAFVLCFTGPVFFSQKRLTKGGRVFTLYKFRTMRVDAETASGPTFAHRNDPRITMLGSVLRRTRLDEIPQLLNVLLGDMSLIGPRPERPEFAHSLSERIPRFPERLQVKAGLTGLAQVRAGYASSQREFRKKLSYDLLYIKHRCLLLDLRIAAHTVAVVLTGKGAQ
jgi:lipopolysaccharide/colanic/teichoic acid biosynthesis glycosyltransferase